MISMEVRPPHESSSMSEFMRRLPWLAVVAADSARARARETGTPIVIMRDGVIVHEYDPPPLGRELRGGPGEIKSA